ncbi:hypothetical protein GPJ56_007479 [Histomonas meleagridis]|uniref:uncharacterized protein n=1 Tax=Histomonas meleagridis TaxID=135588 RepID=UPI0035593F35|nr:hypothetical protein GPJ56_007479 [Histomonas meleagridis]KAH0804325.1 hypothetical protein GO595_003155 [Histomonas meleagridis]
MDSVSPNFSPSPAFLISQMSDPTSTLSSLCLPFLHQDISAEKFIQDNMVSTVLIPNMKKSILNHELESLNGIPDLIKIIIDNLGEEMLDQIKNEILDSIITTYLNSSDGEEEKFLDLYCDSVSSISSRFRDDILVEAIFKYSTSEVVKLRVLSVAIITLVRKNYRIINQFQTLASDSDPLVRVKVINSLVTCTFRDHIIEPILNAGAHDESDLVRNAAASVFGYITPHMTDTYIGLLHDPKTTVSALSCFSQMVSFSEFGQFFSAFTEAIKNFPETAAKVLVEIAPLVDPSEHRLLYKCAKMLRNVPTFVQSFHQFAQCFGNKKRFLRFFYNHEMSNEIRKLYAQQLKYFANEIELNDYLNQTYFEEMIPKKRLLTS